MKLQTLIRSKFAVQLLFLFFLLLTIIIADKLYGYYYIKSTQELIYPPCSKARHQSGEFDITVKINKLGFRDHEYPLNKKKKQRITVIGDSFTFGWGVNAEDCWVKILENDLTKTGLDVEVLNLGKGGASPVDYAQIAEKTIPFLKPDLVVVCVLQANDLHQLIHAYDSLPKPKIEEIKQNYFAEKTAAMLNRVFPNFIKRLSVQNINISQQWKQDASALLKSFHEEQKLRFDTLDEKIKTDFKSGLLNPWLIHQAVYYPDYFTQPLDTADLDVVIGISAMADCFTKIKKICSTNNSQLIVISIPNLPYSSKEEMVELKKYGFSVPDSISGNQLADETIKMAAAESEIEFYSVSENFRKSKKETNLYYPFDGHFTKEGNRVFAASVIEVFERKIKTN